VIISTFKLVEIFFLKAYFIFGKKLHGSNLLCYLGYYYYHPISNSIFGILNLSFWIFSNSILLSLGEESSLDNSTL